MAMGVCSLADCDRSGKIRKGLCDLHYYRLRRTGTTDAPANSRAEWPARFWNKVDIGDPNACWEWTGYRAAFGHGRVGVNGVSVQTHRVAWTLTNGDIPDGLCVCHRCDNPPCVNPAHLFLGTKADNTRDMHQKGRTFRPTRCPYGHDYDAENTVYGSRGGRMCRICRNERSKIREREKRQRQRAARTQAA